MRDVLFRGKRVDNGEWVYGFLVEALNCVTDKNETFIIEQDATYFTYGEFACAVEVKPETVGQFTGLCDKNGKKIFEGDIISAVTLDTGEEQRAVIGFGNFIDENNNDEYIGFFIEFDGIKTTITQLAMEECKNRIEVIGNIYDNPELCEVAEIKVSKEVKL